MAIVNDFNVSSDQNTIAWYDSGECIVKRYSYPILSWQMLRDGSGIAIVESPRESGSGNAAVFNMDGSERFRLRLPDVDSYGGSDFQVYYVNDMLNFIADYRGTDLAVEVNEHDGAINRMHETR